MAASYKKLFKLLSELHTALREIGIDLENQTVRTYTLKDLFKSDSLYI